ncbi:MAG: hypothetical protein WAT66_12835 [Actinomycetota bacterium]
MALPPRRPQQPHFAARAAAQRHYYYRPRRAYLPPLTPRALAETITEEKTDDALVEEFNALLERPIVLRKQVPGNGEDALFCFYAHDAETDELVAEVAHKSRLRAWNLLGKKLFFPDLGIEG